MREDGPSGLPKEIIVIMITLKNNEDNELMNDNDF